MYHALYIYIIYKYCTNIMIKNKFKKRTYIICIIEIVQLILCVF